MVEGEEFAEKMNCCLFSDSLLRLRARGCAHRFSRGSHLETGPVSPLAPHRTKLATKDARRIIAFPASLNGWST
jgi:hypothetical protein